MREILREAEWVTGETTRIVTALTTEGEIPLKTVRFAYEEVCSMTGHVARIRTRLMELSVKLAMPE